MNFRYLGFSHQTTDFRLYSFEGIVSPEIRRDFLVTADIALLAKHHIRFQEVPMLCLQLLETSAEAQPQLESFVLTEADMLTHARAKAVEAEKAAKRARRPYRPANPAALGMAWRSHQSG